MFFGSTPKEIGNYIHSEFKKHNPKRIFSPFAGGFAIEQIASIACPDCKVLSSDVTIYSAALGYYLSDKPTDIQIKQSTMDMIPFLNGKSDSETVAAAIIVFSDLANFVKKGEKTTYYEKLAKHLVKDYEHYHNKAVDKLRRIKSIIKNLDFFCLDAVELLKKVEPGDIVYFDPPYFAGDYEKMFQLLPIYFDFTEPKYTFIDKEMIYKYLVEFDKKGVLAYYRCFNMNDDLPENFKLSMVFQHKYHSYHCMYSNADSGLHLKRFVALKETVKKYKIASMDFRFDENTKIEIVKIGNDIANHYRMMWVKKAEMKQPNYSFLVLGNGEIIGLICINSGMAYGIDKATIISDPASPMTRYKRLSKLILHLILTQDFVKKINELTLWEHTGFTTIAYTNNAVSMKYRGLFELSKRDDLLEGNYKYKLTYHSKKLFESIDIAYKLWLKKYAD